MALTTSPGIYSAGSVNSRRQRQPWLPQQLDPDRPPASVSISPT